jgi:hypothetical protein
MTEKSSSYIATRCGTSAHSLKLLAMKTSATLMALNALTYALLLASATVSFQATYRLPPLRARSDFAIQSALSCLPKHDGFLRARIRGTEGTSDTNIDWHDGDMQCDGGLRPDDRGFRLTFAGRLAGSGRPVRLVFGIASSVDIDKARNVPTNVTIIFEDAKKLYSTASEGKCTIDELTLQPADAKHGDWRRVLARGFCTVPITAISGEDALVLDRFDFAGGFRDEDHHAGESSV